MSGQTARRWPEGGSPGGARRHTVAGLLLALCGSLGAVATPLDLEERVACQRAIEEALWARRIWPPENSQPKPPLAAVLSDTAIRERALDTLRKTEALQTRWGRPVTTESLQAEINRIGRDTRDRGMLRDLYAALGHDPERIAECLARPTLAERWVRDSFAQDPSIHATVRARAEAALAADRSTAGAVLHGGSLLEVEYVLSDEAAGTDSADDAQAPGAVPIRRLDAEGRARLKRRIAEERTLPGELGSLREVNDGFVATAVVSETRDRIRLATVSWPKLSFDTWWESERTTFPATLPAPAPQRSLSVAAVTATACTDDGWTPTRWGAPLGRTSPGMVWTGSEVLVFGGYTQTGDFAGTNTGARYDPATDTWTEIRFPTFPMEGRLGATTIWTGTEMIVWGGEPVAAPLQTGGRYNPTTRTWTATSTAPGVPAGRYAHTAIWSGTEMIVWGGDDGSVAPSELNNGARYNPVTDTWQPTGLGPGVPSARREHTAVWTGGRMIVWGGMALVSGQYTPTNTGAAYNPANDTWTTLPTTGAPAARWAHVAVWTGTEMIVWAGTANGTSGFNTGGRFKPSTMTWTATATAGAPSARLYTSVVWTGTRMIIWGGGFFGLTNTGGRYDPVGNSWLPTSIGPGVPTPRLHVRAVWTGTEMMVWGGSESSGFVTATGGRYNPTSDTWVPTSTGASVPAARQGHTAVWTGAEMIVWGGVGIGYMNTGGRYSPAADSWLPTSTGTSVPAGRRYHSAIWTGTEMIVWGGGTPTGTNTGGRYSPTGDSWTPTGLGSGVPAPKANHSTVWTGSEMVVWAGGGNSGGRYDPVADSWQPTSTASAPQPRSGQSTIWSSTEMIIWGGSNGGSWLDTGGRYDPAADTWLATSVGPLTPSARDLHVAEWTGSRMVIWGGQDSGSLDVNTGGLYDPMTDSWVPTSMSPAPPAAREDFVSVWSGQEMIVWAGRVEFQVLPIISSGGRYSPATGVWRPTADNSTTPLPRYDHTAVWTGEQMIVWGGYYEGVLVDDPHSSGGLYCAVSCPGPGGPSALTATEQAAGTVRLAWSGAPGALAYDLTRGSLAVLRATGGNFTLASDTCPGDNVTTTTLDDPGLPPAGDGYWYLVRGLNCSAGTYDSGGTSQVGSRDAELAAAAGSCR